MISPLDTYLVFGIRTLSAYESEVRRARLARADRPVAVRQPGSGRTNTVSTTLTTSSAGRSARLACSRTASGLVAW